MMMPKPGKPKRDVTSPRPLWYISGTKKKIEPLREKNLISIHQLGFKESLPIILNYIDSGVEKKLLQYLSSFRLLIKHVNTHIPQLPFFVVLCTFGLIPTCALDASRTSHILICGSFRATRQHSRTGMPDHW